MKKKEVIYHCRECVYWDREMAMSLGNVCHLLLHVCRDMNVASSVIKNGSERACKKFVEREPDYCQYCKLQWDKTKTKCKRCMKLHEGMKER